MTISISISDILARIYAQVALGYAVSTPDTPVLTPDSDPALTLLVESVAADISLAVLPILDDIFINENTDGMIRYLIFDDCRINPVELRLLTEQAIVSYALAEVYCEADPEVSDRFMREAQKKTDRLQELTATAYPLQIYPFPN